jgi:hypothetical protein
MIFLASGLGQPIIIVNTNTTRAFIDSHCAFGSFGKLVYTLFAQICTYVLPTGPL